jgi:hypothetical protein
MTPLPGHAPAGCDLGGMTLALGSAVRLALRRDRWLARWNDDLRRLYPVSTTETDRVISAKEMFWSIVTPRSDDETETDDARQLGGRGDQGHPAGHAAAPVG